MVDDLNYSYVGVRGFGQAGDYNTRILLLIDGNRANEGVYDSFGGDLDFPLDIDLIDPSRLSVAQARLFTAPAHFLPSSM